LTSHKQSDCDNDLLYIQVVIYILLLKIDLLSKRKRENKLQITITNYSRADVSLFGQKKVLFLSQNLQFFVTNSENYILTPLEQIVQNSSNHFQ
jgi:hypothetical protein